MGFAANIGLQARYVGLPMATAAVAAAITLSPDTAVACRGLVNWPTGAKDEVLKPEYVVVKARLIESYRAEKPAKTIMGIPHGMIYLVKIEEVQRGSENLNAADSNMFVRLRPSVCEAYSPRDFGPTGVKTLVLAKDENGLWDIIGGEGPKY